MLRAQAGQGVLGRELHLPKEPATEGRGGEGRGAALPASWLAGGHSSEKGHSATDSHGTRRAGLQEGSGVRVSMPRAVGPAWVLGSARSGPGVER